MKKNSPKQQVKKRRSLQKPELYVIIPLLNEAGNVASLLENWRLLEKNIRDHRVNYVIVDDGSTDGTFSIAKQYLDGRHAVVLSHDTNRGPGYAFGTAFDFLSSRIKPSDRVVTIEGDNTSKGELVPTMLERLEREDYDVILASPYAYGGGIQNTRALRVILSHGANAFVKLFLGIHGIHTMSSFFRIYTGETILKLQSRYGPRIVQRPGFESMIELLKKLMLQGARISEVPMKLDTSKRKGASKMKIVRTILGYLTLYVDMRKWHQP